MPRILLVTPQPFFEDRGTPIAVRMVAKALGEIGYEVDLLSFPIGRHVDLPGTTLHRCSNPFSIRSVKIGFSLQKVLLDASLLHSFSERLKSGHYVAVHAVEEAAYMAALLCPPRNIPFIFDMASVIPQELDKRPILRAAGAGRLAAIVERNVLARAAHVICSMGLRNHVLSQSDRVSVSEWKFPATPYRVDTAARNRLRRELGVSSADRVVLYAGNFAAYQGVKLLFDAFDIARAVCPELFLVCIGATEDERSAIAGMVAPEMGARMRILLRQRQRDMPAFLAAADVLVSPRTETGNLPLKIFDYLAAERPIVATRGASHEPLLSSSRAMLCDPDPQAFAEGLLEVTRSPRRAQELTRNATRYCEDNLSWNEFTDFLANVYQTAAASAPYRGLIAAA